MIFKFDDCVTSVCDVKAVAQMDQNERAESPHLLMLYHVREKRGSVYSEVGYVIICFCQHDYYLKIKDRFYMFTIYFIIVSHSITFTEQPT